MAPSDFHLFGPMKEHLWGQKFAEDDGVMEAVPQACGQVDQVCCEAGGLCRKIRHKQFL